MANVFRLIRSRKDELMKKVLLLLLLLVCIVFNSCTVLEYSWFVREKEYYSDKDNFITASATVYSIEQHKKHPFGLSILMNLTLRTHLEMHVFVC